MFTNEDENDSQLNFPKRPSPFSSDPTDQELAFDWTLSENDKQEVFKCRLDDNQRIFAIQLCTLRKHGYFLKSYQEVPLKIVHYINQQLNLSPVLFLECQVRDATKTEYEQRICNYLGYKKYDEETKKLLCAWIFDKISQSHLPQDLILEIDDVLNSWKVVLPGRSIIERLVTNVYSKFEKDIFDKIIEHVHLSAREEIDQLLLVSREDGKSEFYLLKEYPPEASSQNIITYINRYHLIKSMGIKPDHLQSINPRRVHSLAQLAKNYNAYQLRRFPENKRYAMVVCFLSEIIKDILDYIVLMHDQFLMRMNRRAKISYEKKHKALRKQHNYSINTLIKLSKTVLSKKDSPESNMAELFQIVTLDEIYHALDSCEKYKRLEEVEFVGELQSRYSWIKQYIPYFFELPFQGVVGTSPIINALEIARKLNRGDLKAVPPDTLSLFVPTSWQKALYNKNGTINRHVWEIALAFSLRDRLRSREIFLSESRRFLSFQDIIYSQKAWKKDKDNAYASLEMPTKFDDVLGQLQAEFDEIAHKTRKGLPHNRYTSIKDGSLKVKRLDALEIPEEVTRIKHLLSCHLPKIRIEDLLLEVDSWSGFTKQFRPLEGYNPKYDNVYQALLAALVAHGTNLGILTMAASTNNITLEILQNTRWLIREATIKAANNALVNFHSGLPLSSIFGDAKISSSDGQRFGIKPSSLIGGVYPRYFGYYGRAVTVYTHMSDQYSVYSTKVISCLEREAPYVLDGLVENDTVLSPEQHYTDTHGFVEILFALCYLLGISFMPRIKNIKKQKLYKIDKSIHYGDLEPLFSGSVDVELIKEQWDPMIRVAASVVNRVTPANIIVKHLVKTSRSDRLSKAFTALGRVLKTAFILRYIHEEDLRRMVLLQLNRGESRHYLANHLFFADQGDFQTGDYEEIMNKASCLSLLSNSVVVWNTVKIKKIIDHLREKGEVIEDEHISRISPLMFAHVIPNGTYNFSKKKSS